MARQMSRQQRKEAFLAAAGETYDALEEWYDAHPQATFGEIEEEARHRRRELMGQALEILVNGRDQATSGITESAAGGTSGSDPRGGERIQR